MGQRIVQVIGKEVLEIINKKYKNPVAIPYKKELANDKLDDLLEEFPEKLALLRIDNYYHMDFDITQDFVGVFNKTEMTRFLTDNHDFWNRGEYDDGSNIIIDNNKTVGIDCLTWLNSNAKVKMYNKFVCQITNPGVNKQIGNHIIDFIVQMPV
ncbi:Hypothetical protein CINCED_3A012654 [Cinara cedri]|uniref:Uncharacterized protein n=1 Tax=Cinara cedri TaxID=506608 RepID=A0A5E4M9T3_9HEMI|nr:Hypothetical protein CINCED_3A012654 [Cinara cedri]